MKKIDILLATYNGEKYLKEQLDSILNQTYKEFNLIISDDCSSDNTRNILQEYADKDNRIEIIFQEKNIGSNKNFEFLLTKIKSEYYMFSDQDDIWMEDKVEVSLDAIEKNNADLIFTDLEVVDEKLNTIKASFNKKMKLYRKIKKYNDIRMEYLYNCVTGCTIMGRSSMLKEILPMPDNKDILHDYWIALVTSIKGKIHYIDRPTIKYRQHLDNQVGTRRYTDKFGTFDKKRNYIINLKIEKFKTYLNRNDIFDSKLQLLNKEALEYFEKVSQTKNFNFKRWNVYNKVFKYESLGYYMFYFFFYNMPIFYRIGYKIYSMFKK